MSLPGYILTAEIYQIKRKLRELEEEISRLKSKK